MAGPHNGDANGGRTLDETIRIMASWLRLIVAPGTITEVRAVEIKTPYGRPHVESGYFDHDHLEEAAEEAARLSLKAKAKAVYFVLNPIAPDLLARRANRVDRVGEGDGTGEKHIIGRRWLLVDADPTRDAKISSSDAEKAEARAVIQAVREFLTGRGWPAPVLADSGNGYHLLYRIDLPADDGGLVKRVLQALSQRFTTGAVKIDTAVHNPACPTKLYGTVARKGDDVPALSRVHRGSQLLEIPGCPDPCDATTADVRIVPKDLLEALAAEAKEEAKTSPPPGPKPSTNGHGYQHRLDVAKWLTARRVAFRVKSVPASGGRTVYLITCPFDPSHTGGDTCVMQDPSGKFSAHCFHDSCSGRGWQDFKQRIGKPDPDHYEPPMQRFKRSSRTGGKKEADGAAPAGGPDEPNLTDRGNGIRLVREFGPQFRYCHPWKKWLVWADCRWQVDCRGTPAWLAKCTIVKLFESTLEEMSKIKRELETNRAK